ncbi:MAG: octaprenyl-diphosphate synthase [Dasania sp.]
MIYNMTITATQSETKSRDGLHIVLKNPLSEIEHIIHSAFAHEKLPMLKAISGYIIGSGGKRIRPLLCIAIGELLGNVNQPLLKTAAALEFIHTATLLHDDVVDKGDMRRGNKAAHLIWGNQASILSGDHMFASAFTMLADTDNIEAIKMMSNAAKMLAHGEIIQLSLKQVVPKIQDHFDILSHKTAALFASGCACGAIFNQATASIVQSAYDFGFNFGIAFQLVDDILDYQGNEVFGKKIGTDFFEGKFTLPIILAYQDASESDKKFIHDVMLKQEERSDDDLRHIKQIITKLDTIAQSRTMAKLYIQKAQENLSCFNATHPVYEALTFLLQSTLFRKI